MATVKYSSQIDLKMHKITIFDTDGGNPYGREVAKLLANAGADVCALVPVDTHWIPNSLQAQKIQPANGNAGRFMQGLRFLHTISVVFNKVFVQRRILVVIMTRDWYDQAALALIAMCGASVVVVAHDPSPKVPLKAFRLFCRNRLWKNASALIAHSKSLADEARVATGREVATVPHLPFLDYSDWAKSTCPDIPSSQFVRLMVLGQMRPDKGLENLPSILLHMTAQERSRFSLSFVGRGTIPNVVEKVQRLIQVSQKPSPVRLGDHEIAQALANADILLAPYSVVSASGTVVLGLCRGLKVVAYNSGAISEVVSPIGLVASGDELSFARRIVELADASASCIATSLPNWTSQSLESWIKVIRSARR